MGQEFRFVPNGPRPEHPHKTGHTSDLHYNADSDFEGRLIREFLIALIQQEIGVEDDALIRYCLAQQLS